MLKKKAKRRTSLGEKAITLIALVVTIVILLILAAVTITMTLGENGLFQRSKAAKDATIKAMADEEVELAVSNLKMETTIRKLTQEGSRKFLEDDLKKSDKDTTVTINGNDLKVKHRGNNYNVDQDCNLTDEGDFDAAEWDKTAVPENMFYWKSDDPNEAGYNTIIGYKAGINNYTILRYPTRCYYIDEDLEEVYSRINSENNNSQSISKSEIRSFTNNIKKEEQPDTIITVSGTGFRNEAVEEVRLSNNLISISDRFFHGYSNLRKLYLPKSVINIGDNVFEEYGHIMILAYGKAGCISGAPWGMSSGIVIWNYNDAKKDKMTEQEKIEWDKTAVPENEFYWESDDPNNEGYNTVIGYKASITNYTILKYPSRCKIIDEDQFEKIAMNIPSNQDSPRSYTKNIKKIEYSNNVIAINGNYFYYSNIESTTLSNNLRSLGSYSLKTTPEEELILPDTLEYIGNSAFGCCQELKKITMKNKVTNIGKHILGRGYNGIKEITILGTHVEMNNNAFIDQNNITINLTASKDSISGAPWGAYNATVNWNYTGE